MRAMAVGSCALRLGLGVMVTACAVFVSAGGSVAAGAAVAAPAWQVTEVAEPTVLVPGVDGKPRYFVAVENVGGAPSEGEFTIRVGIPSRFSVLSVGSQRGVSIEPGGSCVQEGASVVCNSTESVVPGGFVAVEVPLEVTGSTGAIDSVATVTGGGAAVVASDRARMSVGSEHAPAGIGFLRSSATGPAGEALTQAAGHPTLFTNTMLFNNLIKHSGGYFVQPVEPVKNLVFYLPLGMLGNPTITNQCTVVLIETTYEQTGCPLSSRVGSILPMVLATVAANGPDSTHGYPVYSVQPEKGYAAEFAFADTGLRFVQYVSVVRHDGRYMLRDSISGVPLAADLIGLVQTIDGDIREPGGYDRGAYLTNPSVCSSEPLDSTLEIDTWDHQHTPIVKQAPAYPVIEGCSLLQFSTQFSSQPSTSQADEPSGYTIDVGVPQAPNDFAGLGTPPYKTVSVTMPEGTSLSPAGADGLSACEATGSAGINIEDSESEAIGPDGLPRPVAGHCPASSQVASVRAKSPDLSEDLTGHMFLAQPGCGGSGQPECTGQDAKDGNLFRLYLELEAPMRGVIVKLEGKALVDPNSGRVTTVFDDTPQFPVSDLVVETNGGPQAPLANPQSCGTATSTSDVTPWSTPATPDSISSSSFNVDWDGQGGGCPGTIPFAASFTAGTVNPLAGAFSSLTVTLSRHDREQSLSGVSVTTPPGLLGAIKGIPRCGELQAAQGTCPAASRIGVTHVAAGAGPGPLWQEGRVYLTDGYEGQPFGLSIVVPAVAGPFNLGNIVVRASIHVDPYTAALTVTSDPLPQMIDG
ncbi:MAG: hypothetical protein ACRDJ3_03005, partial [Solirubrobacteraceae bacterium]